MPIAETDLCVILGNLRDAEGLDTALYKGFEEDGVEISGGEAQYYVSAATDNT